MTWNECNLHPDVYFESIECPKCKEAVLIEAIQRLFRIHVENMLFDEKLLCWCEAGLNCLDAIKQGEKEYEVAKSRKIALQNEMHPIIEDTVDSFRKFLDFAHENKLNVYLRAGTVELPYSSFRHREQVHRQTQQGKLGESLKKEIGLKQQA